MWHMADRRSGPRRSPRAKPTISPGRREPGEQVYRYAWANSEKARWIIALGLIVMMPVCAVVVGVGVPLLAALFGREVDGGVMAALLVGAMLAPIGVAAVMGGMAIHRLGWIPGVIFFAAFFLILVGGLFGPWGYVAGIGLMVVAVAAFWLVGSIRGVPMYVGNALVGKVPVTDGTVDGELSPGVKDPDWERRQQERIPFPTE